MKSARCLHLACADLLAMLLICVYSLCRLLKALAERLKRDAAEREAAREFEITDSGSLPSSMRTMEPQQSNGAQENHA